MSVAPTCMFADRVVDRKYGQRNQEAKGAVG
jgi:hypothetical protein